MVLHATHQIGRSSVPPNDSVRDPRGPVFGFHGQLVFGSERREDSPALRMAGGFNFTALSPTADVYVEVPAGWLGRFDAGAGVAGQLRTLPVVLPYLQFGAMIDEERSWFTNQAVGYLRTGTPKEWSLVWMPTLAVTRKNRFRRASLFASGVVGPRRSDCRRRECPYLGRHRTYLVLGASLEMALPARGPYPPLAAR
jgi:hypothetical protein